MSLRSSWPAALVGSSALALVLSGALPATAGAPTPPRGPDAGAEPGRAPDAPGDAAGDRGRWDVTALGDDRYTISWTSPTELPVTDARPEIVGDASAAGTTTLDADGRTVEVTVASSIVPDVADYDVVLSGQILDSDQPLPAGSSAPYRLPAQAVPIPDADDPGVPGTHETVSSDYRLPAVKLPDIGQKAEMMGHVVAPTDADDSSPLVLFLHGRHGACYQPGDEELRGLQQAAAEPRVWRCYGTLKPVPSHLGYDYVQQLLASQGYVTVSISANAINDLDFEAADGGATARAALIRAHLNAWSTTLADEYDADLSNVVLVGHSRGGEGANRASLDQRADAPYDITGQVLIGPTDFGFQSAPSTPTVTLLPYCDGDVRDLQGQSFTDAGRDLTDDLALHSSVMVMGANHNFFNTEWTPGLSVAPSFDDWYSQGPARTKTCGRLHPMRLSKQEQQDVGSAYIAGAVHLFADGDQSVLPLFDGSAVTVPSAGNADVRSHAIGGGLEIRRPGLDGALATGPTAADRLCVGQADAERTQVCEPGVDSSRTPHWPSTYVRAVTLRRAWEVAWTATGQESALALADAWDLTGMSSLDLRTIVQPGQGAAELHVRLTDGSGDSAVVVPEGDGVLNPFPGGVYGLAKRWAQDLRLPLAGVSGVDLSDIVSVAVVSANQAGRVWVLDLVAHPAGALPAPPAETLPTVSFGRISQAEGDGSGEATLEIPYTVDGGPLGHDAVVRMIPINGLFDWAGAPSLLQIPAGTESGTVDLAYRPNRVDDYPRIQRHIAMFPVTGIATNRYVGTATVVDDDPTPRVTIAPVRKRIREGATARWRVTLSSPAGYYVEGGGGVVRGGGKGKRLTVGDLPKEFREDYLYPVPPLDRPLFKTDLGLYGNARPGRTSFVVELPTRATKKDQGDRSVTLRFQFWQDLRVGDPTHTIIVTD